METVVIYEQDNYRITREVSEGHTIEDLAGDSYEGDEQGLKDFIDYVNQEGVFGFSLERWNPSINAGWEHIDSCYGFVGQTESDGSDHYIVAELKSQIVKEPINAKFQAQVTKAIGAITTMLETAPIECVPGNGYNCYFRIQPSPYINMGYDKKGPDFELSQHLLWTIEDVAEQIGIEAVVKGRHVQFWAGKKD